MNKKQKKEIFCSVVILNLLKWFIDNGIYLCPIDCWENGFWLSELLEIQPYEF